MRIILIRHGKPDAPAKNITANHFHNWIAAYNSATLCQQTLPPAKTLEAIHHCSALNCFVGHGLLNRYIAQSLISNGWTSSSNSRQGYWDFGIYEYHNA